MWHISVWVPHHTWYGSVVGNNNRSIKSKHIASHILHCVRADIAFLVKQVRAYIKNNLDVDISYNKAWHGRRKAIEEIYGSWESNFNVLPKYIAALQSSNPDTVVEWLHNGSGSSQVATFKYVFWAFGPSINAFKFCQPVISVDGTHLKGCYRRKLLIVVTKDANNYIMPIAFAIVDEETVESWCWFFKQFHQHIWSNKERKICVISDRHNGIIHAMKHLPEWQEPNAYHRFCLRHVCSNLMSQFKFVKLKKLCWAAGSTTQKRKYKHWNIGLDRWTLLHDTDNRRWGSCTTNISESLNNALRGARMLPIKARIKFTFEKVVQQFQKHTEIVMNCNTALPPHMWNVFNSRDHHAQGHTIMEFNYREGRYRVFSMFLRNREGGNDYDVRYKSKKCSYGKWQTQRFPCSHAIVVCRHRGETPHDIISNVYTTETYRNLYRGDFVPLPHPDELVDPGWRIQADYSKISTSRGRRRSRRFPNEMDFRHPDEPIIRRCTLCGQTGHNRMSCPNSHP